MSRTAVIARAHAYFDSGAFITDLTRRVAIRAPARSRSAPACCEATRRRIAPALAPLGFTSRVFDNPIGKGLPFLAAERIEDPDLVTVLMDGHGDTVRGLDDLWRPGLSPWTLTVEGQLIMAAAPPTTKASTASTSRRWRRCSPSAIAWILTPRS